MTDQTICTFWSAGRQGYLPAEVVLNISAITPATPIPFGSSIVEGMVSQEHGPCCQIDWTAHWGGAAGSGTYRMRIRTARGPVWFRVDSVALTTADDSQDSTQPELEALVTSWSAGFAASLPDPVAPSAPDDELALLMFETRGQILALPATSVLRIERPLGIWPLRSGHSSARRVALQQGMMAGLALGQWLNPESPSQTDDWALMVATATGPLALLVQRIHGLLTVSRQDLRLIVHGESQSVWYHDAKHGPIELLELAAFAGQQAQTPLASILRLSPEIAPTSTPGQETRQGLGVRRGLVAQLGHFGCVFPGSRILQVDRVLAPAFLKQQRHPGHAPLFDLAMLLGQEPQALTQSRILWLARDGRPPLAILVRELTILRPDQIEHALPALPPPLHDWFSSLIHEDAHCLFLFHSELLHGRFSHALKARAQAAFRGWIPRMQHPDT